MQNARFMKGFIFAGEKSGDRQGGAIYEFLKKSIPNLETFGVGGPQLIKEGLCPISDFKNFQVMGFKDVIFSLPNLYRQFRLIKEKIIKENPSFCLFIDSPDFSMRMQKSLRKAGYKGKIIQHVCPSIWAWKKKRKETLEENIDLLTALLPFEADLFKESPLKVAFVGHPLTEKILSFIEKESSSDFLKCKKILSIFPGSRTGEIARNLSFQLSLASSFIKAHPHYSIAISCCRPELKSSIVESATNNGFIEGKNFFMVSENSNYHLMLKSDLAIATSGTIALELGLFKIPTLISYEMGLLDYVIAKYLFKISLPYYSLVNILMNQALYPEHIGRGLNKNKALDDLEQLYQNKESIKSKLQQLTYLIYKEKGSARSTSEHILEILHAN